MAGSNTGTISGTNGACAPADVQADIQGDGLRIELAHLRTHGPRSLTDNLADMLRHAVRSGRLPAGTGLPASRSLAGDLGVSRGVVVRAYEQLVAEGYLAAHGGRGTTVSAVRGVDQATPPAPPSTSVPANPGLPDLGWFPRTAWLRAMETAVRELPDHDLGYGDPRGHPRLRRALAAYLGRTRAVVAPVDRIVVTAGFAQGVRLVAEALTRQGIEAVAVEDPGSVGVVDTVRAGGLAVQPVPVDEQGIDVAALAGTGLRVAVVTPAHQFPTGAVLAPARRAALLDWAEEHRGVVVEDDYDAEYRYDRSPVGALQGLAPDRVVYGGSLSKTLAPGLRLGWVVAPSWLAGSLTEAKYLADIATPVIDQLALAVFIETGALDRHIRRTGLRYAERRRRLLEAVARHLPGWSVTGVAAGLHAVLVPPRGPSGPSPAGLREMVAAAGALGAVPLAAYAEVAPTRAGVVVGYGGATPDQVEHAISAMAASAR